jgi:putative tryptophan/tyrosine transport system substrate-binding protein
LGWSGNNLQIDFRWTGGSADLIRKYAAELVALNPDVIFIAGGSHVGAMQQVTRTVPIVFVEVADAVGGGFVESLSHPGGNATGFTNYEYNISGKWLEFLKQIAPRITRVAFLRDATNPNGAAQFGVIQGLARPLGVVDPVAASARWSARVAEQERKRFRLSASQIFFRRVSWITRHIKLSALPTLVGGFSQ